MLNSTVSNMQILQLFAQTLQAQQVYTVFAIAMRNAMCYADVDGGCVYSRDGHETLEVQGEWAAGEVNYGMHWAAYAQDGDALEIEFEDGETLQYSNNEDGWDSGVFRIRSAASRC